MEEQVQRFGQRVRDGFNAVFGRLERNPNVVLLYVFLAVISVREAEDAWDVLVGISFLYFL